MTFDPNAKREPDRDSARAHDEKREARNEFFLSVLDDHSLQTAPACPFPSPLLPLCPPASDEGEIDDDLPNLRQLLEAYYAGDLSPLHFKWSLSRRRLRPAEFEFGGFIALCFGLRLAVD